MNEPQTHSVQSVAPGELDQYLNQLLRRDRFRKAPSLRQLLQYLVNRGAEGRFDEIKESTIAIDVFGRSHDFDGRLDNIVRVQAHRLRKTLESHYEGEGATDRFRISIPKGAYVPAIEARQVCDIPDPVANGEQQRQNEGELISAKASAVATLPSTGSIRRRPRSFWIMVAFLGGIITTLPISLLTFHGLHGATRQIQGGEDSLKAPLATLWGSFFQPDVNCIVSFSNPVFLWTFASRGRIFLTYHGPQTAPAGVPVEIAPGDPYVDPDLIKKGQPYYFSDSWTGTGEVLGMYRLATLFAGAGHPLKLVRGRSLTYADLRESNVVFLGSPWGNDMQDKINPGQTPLRCLSTSKITNRDPRQGEEAIYEQVYDPRTKALTASYTLISVLPGVSSGTRIVSSAGLDTNGTAAGIDFLTSTAGVSQIIERFDPVHHRRIPDYFQALIRTQIIRGDPGRWDLVLVRELDRNSLATSKNSR